MAVVNMDAFDFLARLAPESVDCIATDYAYESLEKHRARGTTTRLAHSKASSNDWFQTVPNDRIPELLNAFYRVMKPNTHLYMFCDDETSNHIWDAARGTQFKWWKRIVWNKVGMGMGYHYRAKTEFICFLEKGHRQLTSKSIPDSLDAADLDLLIKQKKIYRGFPTEKPPEVSAVLIEQSTQPGERVIDPFCGSGSVGVAAAILGRKFAGCDICAEAVDIAGARIKEAVDSDVKFDTVAEGGSR